jgi:cell division protein FtsZ
MEVDEAANHIKELVDPDANIIWGSAFNNDLDGKIRVSVVATGIDAQDNAMTPAAPAKVFAFPGPRRCRAGAARRRPPRRPRGARAPSRSRAVAQRKPSRSGTIPRWPADRGRGFGRAAARRSRHAGRRERAEAPMEGDNRSWVAQEEEEAPRAAPAREGGGTLFERMSNIARGAAKAQVDEDAQAPRLRRERDPLDIPRFLNRQNNQ